jgi:hypothetical protein
MGNTRFKKTVTLGDKIVFFIKSHGVFLGV